MVAKMLKILGTAKSSSSTTIIISLAKSSTSQTTKTEKPRSSSPFLEKGKKMLELRAKLLSKRTIADPAFRTVSFDICNSFFADYRKVTEFAY